MKNAIMMAFLMCSMNTALAQLSINFSAQDFLNSQPWRGHLFAFGIEEDSLLRSQTIQSTYLSTPNKLATSVKWEIGIHLGFNPSPSNRLRIYLISDNDTLTAPLNGYFVEIGEAGNTDRYHLYKQKGAQLTLLMSSNTKERADPNLIHDRIQVIRDSQGNWELLTAIDTTNVFTSDGVVTDNDHTHTEFFGIQCQFTANNSDRFGFRYFLIDTTSISISPAIPETKLIPDDTTGTLFFESFDDGIGNHWLGHTASTQLVNERLKLDSNATSPMIIYADNDRIRNTAWEAGVDINGALSTNNFVRLYLATSDDPSGPHQGYHLQIDGSSGNHTYRLWKQNGATRSSVFQSTPIPNQHDKFRARVRVVCDINGQWQILTDEYNSGKFENLVNTSGYSTVSDTTYINSSYLGYQANFTITRREDFKLDYLLIKLHENIITPQAPLLVNSVTATSDTTLRITFNRTLDSVSSLNNTNYTLDNGYGHPDSTYVRDSTVVLKYLKPLMFGKYVLSVENVKDTVGIAVQAGADIRFEHTLPPPLDVKLIPDDTVGVAFFADFSNGTGNPWLGNTASTQLINERLRLDSNATSPMIIYTDNDRIRNTVWEAGVDINGALSTNNFVRLYLATSDDPSGPHQGYHLQIDGSSGNHTYRLWKQNGATRSSVFQSSPIPNQHDKFRARVRVVCDINGQWQILADEYDSGTFEILINADGDSLSTDQTYNTSTYLGYQVNFTPTRREDFKLDYLLVKQHEDIPILSEPLKVNSIEATNDTTLLLIFSRMLDNLSGETTENYTLDNSYGHPLSVQVADSMVTLVFDQIFVAGDYMLSVSNVTDTAGISMEAGTIIDFVYTGPPLPEIKLAPDDMTNALFFDDFSEGIGGHWLGDIAVIKLVDERLKLDTSASSPTVIHTGNDRVRNTVWEAGIDIDGTLSSSNYVRIYLATTEDPAGSHQGYHLQIDGSSGHHSYRLWRQNGGTRSTVFQSTPIPNQHGKYRARVRVVCDINGEWQVFADEYDSGMFETLINAESDSLSTDQTYTTSTYLGYQTNFTPTRREDFKLDYLLIKEYEDIPVLPDPLVVYEIEATNDTTLLLVFDRVLDSLSGETPENYSLNRSYQHPVSAQVANSVVTLVFDQVFVSGDYVLSISNVTDTAGVAVEAGTTIDFVYTGPPLPETKLAPDDMTNALFFDDFSEGIGSHWLGDTSSLELSDKRMKLDTSASSPTVIYTANDRVRNTVWEAGIDIDGTLSSSNYIRLYLATTEDPAGSHQGYHLQIDGSSGNHSYRLWRQNSETRSTVFQSKPISSQHGKFRARVRVVCDINGEWQVLVDEYDSGIFETLVNADGDSLSTDQTYTTSTYLGHQTNFTPTKREEFKLDYILVRPYEDIASPPEIFPGEILINEILSNPKPDGVDFVELYNHSDKAFDLQMLYLANVSSSGQVAAHRQVATRYTLFHPYTYIVLTTTPDIVKKHYPSAVDHTFVPMVSFPAFPNTEGGVVILSNDRVIDSLRYSASMHSSFIVDAKGVSLEREAFHLPTNAIGNFRSASTVVGGATPGYQNSRVSHHEQREGVYLNSRTFSPDNDGFEDVLEINYHFEQDGIMANIDIYSDKGVLVRRLVRNQSLAVKGTIEWDGIADSGRQMPIGIYLALIEIYHASGTKKLYRKSFVLASKF